MQGAGKCHRGHLNFEQQVQSGIIVSVIVQQTARSVVAILVGHQ
jgi:hypothetical protein